MNSNRRSTYAVEERKRYNYQVGVASSGQFSKPAIEFAANNKIPLLSLNWFLDSNTLDLFHSIDQEYLNNIHTETQSNIYKYLKDRQADAKYANRHSDAIEFLEQDRKVGSIIKSFDHIVGRTYVGLIETGDLIFLSDSDMDTQNSLNGLNGLEGLRAQIHYFLSEPNIWLLSIFQHHCDGNKVAELKFFLPDRIMRMWNQYSLDKSKALDIKQEFFSRIFIFNRRRPDMPFIVVNIDRHWLEHVRTHLD